MTQYWYNDIMMSKVSIEEANEIISNISTNPEFKVNTKFMPDYFCVNKL